MLSKIPSVRILIYFETIGFYLSWGCTYTIVWVGTVIYIMELNSYETIATFEGFVDLVIDPFSSVDTICNADNSYRSSYQSRVNHSLDL